MTTAASEKRRKLRQFALDGRPSLGTVVAWQRARGKTMTYDIPRSFGITYERLRKMLKDEAQVRTWETEAALAGICTAEAYIPGITARATP